jgi:flagellar biosynthetic protein FlhB
MMSVINRSLYKRQGGCPGDGGCPLAGGSHRRDRPRPFTLNSFEYLPDIIDLQWFAAEDEGRTEEPSEHKIQKAREEGRVAKSQELEGALVLLLPTAAVWLLGMYVLENCIELLQFFFNRSAVGGAPAVAGLDVMQSGRQIAGVCFFYFIKMTAPIVLIGLIAGIFGNLVQTGPLFTTKPLVPDCSRIIPHFGRYFQKTIGSLEGLFNLFKSVFKMLIIGLVAYFLISGDIQKLVGLQSVPLWTGITTIANIGIRLMLIVALLLLGLSIPDIFVQKWQFKESLKMTKQEVKEEYKELEGDPQMHARIRRRFREIIRSNMVQNVPKATVVVRNPTHFAVALEYHPEQHAPMVTAKGADEVAMRIIHIAQENNVPLVENKPLARALYVQVEVGEMIPDRFWNAVATILQHVYALNEQRRSGVNG